MKRPLELLLALGLCLKIMAVAWAISVVGMPLAQGPTAVQAQEEAKPAAEAGAAQEEQPAAQPPAGLTVKDSEGAPQAQAQDGQAAEGGDQAAEGGDQAVEGAKEAKSGEEGEAAKGEPGQDDKDLGPPTGAEVKLDPRLLKLLEEKRESLDREEDRLKREKEDLESLKNEVLARIDELKKVQTVLEELVQEEKNKRAERIQQLVKVISNMRPQPAAAVVAKLDDQMCVDIFMRMQSRTAGKVMAELEPAKAARISVLLTHYKEAQEAARIAGEAIPKGSDKMGNDLEKALKEAGANS